MAMTNNHKSKFKLSEIFNNSDGKSSGSGFISIIFGLISSLAFILVMIGWWFNKPNTIEISEKVLQLMLLTTSLLGVRKFTGVMSGNKNSTNITNDSELDNTIPKV
jgi:hypothetical protein